MHTQQTSAIWLNYGLACMGGDVDLRSASLHGRAALLGALRLLRSAFVLSRR